MPPAAGGSSVSTYYGIKDSTLLPLLDLGKPSDFAN